MPHTFENPFTPKSAIPKKRLFGGGEERKLSLKSQERMDRFKKIKYGSLEILKPQVKFLEEIENQLEKNVNDGIVKGFIKKTNGPSDKTTKEEIRNTVLDGMVIKADEKGNIKEISWDKLGRLWDLKIETLPAMDELKELEVFSCEGNNFKKLPDLSKLKKLKSLDCHDNDITELPNLDELTNLKKFNCAKNKLKELPNLKNLKDLESLNCSSNKLQKLPELKGLKNLETINCSQNKLTQLPDLAGLEALDRIDCSNNPDMNKIPDLGKTSIYLWINFKGTSIPKKEFEKLQKKYRNIYYG